MIRSLRNARPFTAQVLAVAVACGIAALPVGAQGSAINRLQRRSRSRHRYLREPALCAMARMRREQTGGHPW